MASDRDWRQYERQIFDRLTKLAGEDSVVEFDQSVPGYLSEAERQVDVLVRGRFAGQTATGTMAVDCKCWSKKVDVMDVDRFVGTIEDIRTDFGLLVTTEGFTPAAKRRAENARGIRVDVVPYEELEDWEPPVEICHICTDDAADRPPGIVYIDSFDDSARTRGSELAIGVGVCERCDAIHMECSCGTINAQTDFVHGEWQECEGGCGVEWKVEIEVDRKGMPVSVDPRDSVEFRRP